MQRRNKTYAVITAVVLLIWVTGGSYLFSENCCSDTALTYANVSSSTVAATMLIEDGDAFRVQSSKAILFQKNKSKPVLFEEVSASLIETIQYLKSNPLKKVTIMGLFSGEESGGAQLAKSRGDSIMQLFLRAGTPKYQLSVEAGRRDDLVQDKENNAMLGAIDFIFTCLAPFEVRDPATKFQLKANNNLVFTYSTNDFLMDPTKSKEIKMVLGKLVAYLQNQTGRKLILTGYNHPDEVNQTALPNLGMVRANMLRSLLMSLGAKGSQIEIKGLEDERLAVIESDLYGQFLPNAMGFEFDVLTSAYLNSLERNKKRIELNLKEMQVFRFKDFKREGHEIILDKKSKVYLNNLILYLSINQNAKVYCVGHSNRQESKEKNFELGADRASYTRDFLMSHGIPSERIIIKSAGATHPLGEEATVYGRQINRRVDLFMSYNGKLPKLYALPPRLSSKIEKKVVAQSKNNKTKVVEKVEKDTASILEEPLVPKEKNDSL
jgi:OOP family OmpA-OmpF porin